MKNLNNYIIYLSMFFLVSSCGTYFNQPFETNKARIGESTSPNSILKSILPLKETVVGVYKFRDQTGQYKLVENGSTFSTAVTQGGTSILLKSLADSKWFKPIERENIGNLLNERQIIRSTRQEYSKNSGNQVTSLPPLLFAGVIIEGGVVSYDSNIITGGSGVRYFGAGASNQYREDRITIYLRAVSTSTGQILKNVYVSKTILSQGISANLFRYVNVKRLLEIETGVTKNEPTQLAVKEAIDKAVELLIVEGIIDGLWLPEGGNEVVESIKSKYLEEKENADKTILSNRKLEDRRGKYGISVSAGTSLIDGDFPNATVGFNSNLSIKTYLNNPNFSLGLKIGYSKLENKELFKEDFLMMDVNLEYNFLPYDNFTPFIYGGVGGVIPNLKTSNTLFKLQYGAGFEYLPVNNIGINIFAEHNLVMNDRLDAIEQGKRDDYYWNFAIGVNFYIGKPFKKVESVIFE